MIFQIYHQREMEFAIDLVLGTIPVSMEPYIISSSELGELKIHLGAQVGFDPDDEGCCDILLDF